MGQSRSGKKGASQPKADNAAAAQNIHAPHGKDELITSEKARLALNREKAALAKAGGAAAASHMHSRTRAQTF